jgi:CarD family transcriptional regulator
VTEQKEKVIIHNKYGVCKVVGIIEKKIPGKAEPQKYYSLAPLDDLFGTIVYTPYETSDSGVIRDVLSAEEIDELVLALPQVEPLELPITGNKAADMDVIRTTYERIRYSSEPIELARLLKTIYRKRQNLLKNKKRISDYESSVMDDVEKILFGEIAFSLNISPDEVTDYINQKVED